MLLEKHKKTINLVFFSAIAVAFIALLPRLDGGYFAGKYLWAEDGNVFINQANELGLSSIWTPYAGYFLAYPRLVALLGSFFDLKSQVYILLGGWFLAYCLMMAIIIVRTNNLGLQPFFICILVSLISLQPNYGEVFFNITNSQWMLGLALSIYVLTFENKKISSPEYFLLGVVCLTGPFSILMAPVMVLHGLAHKKIKENIGLYGVVLVCAFIQMGVLLGSDRIAAGLVNQDFKIWIKAFLSLMLFGATERTTFAAAILFWIVFIFCFCFSQKNNLTKGISRKKESLFLLGAAIVNLLAALYSSKADPMAIVFTGSGNRYTWIPYSLILIGAVLVSADFKKLRYLILASIGVIFYVHFQMVSSPNLQFSSYANFSKYKKIIIPINPQWSAYSSWHIDNIGKEIFQQGVHAFKIGYDSIAINGLTMKVVDNILNITSKTNDPILIFENPINCPSASDIGIEIEMNRSSDGWLQLFWSESKSFTENKSLKRFYPAGEIKAQFAFPYFGQSIYIRFDPLEQQGEAKIKEIMVYCLP